MKKLRNLCMLLIVSLVISMITITPVKADDINYQATMELSNNEITMPVGNEQVLSVNHFQFTPELPTETEEIHPDKYTVQYISYSYKISWDSSDAQIASVIPASDDDNVNMSVNIAANKPGKAIIKAYLSVVKSISERYMGPQGISISSSTESNAVSSVACNVIVTQPVSGITLDTGSTEIAIGQNQTLQATISPEDATNKNITWSSSDDTIASVDTLGKVTAKAAGKAVITATTEDGNYQAHCTVETYVASEKITLSDDSINLKAGESIDLTATVYPANAKYKNISWVSDHPEIVSISDNGKIQTISEGKATITVSVDHSNLTAICSVIVTHNLDEISEVESTCTSEGNIHYYKCKACGKYFKDANGNEELSPDAIKTNMKAHTLERIPEKKATLENSGNIEYYKCSVCNKIFSDAEGKKEIKSEDIVINKKKIFDDIPEKAYYRAAVIWAVDNGITNGKSDAKFNPNGYCTRAEMITFLWRYAHEPEPTTLTSPFTDVNENSFYYKAVLWGFEEGIIKGTSTTTFSPNKCITRCQAVTFLHRFSKADNIAKDNTFTDVPATAYYHNAVAWAVEKKITQGTSTTAFSPENNCPRSQVVTFLYRMSQTN